jgi:predicted RNase H-like HicB family nuclease
MSRTKVAAQVTFLVVYEPDDGGWHVHIPEVRGCRSWGRSIIEARRNIREALATCADLFDDPDTVADDATLIDDVRLPARAKRLVRRALEERSAAEQREQKARVATAEAARALTDELGLSLRDAGELLGLSHQRVKQVNAEATPRRRAAGGSRR